jgi:cardiolipin synthase
MTIPNALTFLRLCLIPLIVVLIHERRLDLAFWAFSVAGLTDAIDGWLARKLNQQSEIGAYLDALADKFLIAASFISLFMIGAFPYWIAVLVIFRDLMIVSALAIAWLMDNPMEIEPITISKWNTAAQIGAVAYKLAAGAFGFQMPGLSMAIYGIVAILTVTSVAAYFVKWFRHMAD